MEAQNLKDLPETSVSEAGNLPHSYQAPDISALYLLFYMVAGGIGCWEGSLDPKADGQEENLTPIRVVAIFALPLELRKQSCWSLPASD